MDDHAFAALGSLGATMTTAETERVKLYATWLSNLSYTGMIVASATPCIGLALGQISIPDGQFWEFWSAAGFFTFLFFLLQLLASRYLTSRLE